MNLDDYTKKRTKVMAQTDRVRCAISRRARHVKNESELCILHALCHESMRAGECASIAGITAQMFTRHIAPLLELNLVKKATLTYRCKYIITNKGLNELNRVTNYL